MESPAESCSSIELSEDEVEMFCSEMEGSTVAGSAQCVEPMVEVLVVEDAERTQLFAAELRARLEQVALARDTPLVSLEAAGQQLLEVCSPFNFPYLI